MKENLLLKFNTGQFSVICRPGTSAIFRAIILLALLFLPSLFLATSAATHLPISKDSLVIFKGLVVDKTTGACMPYSSVVVEETSISVVANSEGIFHIKIPLSIHNPHIVIRFLGYKDKRVGVEDIDNSPVRIEMESSMVQLPRLNVVSKDATELVRMMFARKAQNCFTQNIELKTFYRETIKKNKTYVSLSEAVLSVLKQGVNSNLDDQVYLEKSRKKTDYSQLDTLLFKLQGGPFNSLYMDVMANQETLFTDDMFANYQFSFDRTVHSGNDMEYVVDFKPRAGHSTPLYEGKLYIDAHSYALRSAVFSLDISDREAASTMFVLKKPLTAQVYPVSTKYRIDYLQTDGKWYYGYSRIELGLRINWKKRLFNTTYYSTIEMAATEFNPVKSSSPSHAVNRLRPSVIIADHASGFADPAFWGEMNVLEPEKSIDNAIRKIQRQLSKERDQ